MTFEYANLSPPNKAHLQGKNMCFKKTALSLITTILLGAPTAQAQTLPPPKLTHISPSGGQAGTSFELTLSGAEFENFEGLHFSFPGAEVEALGPSQPLNPAEMKKKG